MTTSGRTRLNRVVIGVEGASSCCSWRAGVALAQGFLAFSFSHCSGFFRAKYLSSQPGLFQFAFRYYVAVLVVGHSADFGLRWNPTMRLGVRHVQRVVRREKRIGTCRWVRSLSLRCENSICSGLVWISVVPFGCSLTFKVFLLCVPKAVFVLVSCSGCGYASAA